MVSRQMAVGLAVALGLWLTGPADSARAQQVMFAQHQTVMNQGWPMGGGLSAPISAGGIVQGTTSPSEPLFPYSYYAAYPSPARAYVPYGQNDLFSFDGRAYGHPYDRYSWTYMAGYNDLLNRYYYPPVR